MSQIKGVKEIRSFPWGIYVGDVESSEGYIPVLLDSKQGGFVIIFDESSEDLVTNTIESIALKLLNVMPLGNFNVEIFDYGKKRFMYLGSLSQIGVYRVAYTSQKANMLFDELEELANERHHNLLSFETPTLSEFNEQSSDTIESYKLLLINLDDFPEDMSSAKRVKNFFSSAYDAGFYTIAFGSKELLHKPSKATEEILSYFHTIEVVKNSFSIPKELFEHQELFKEFGFTPLEVNKTTQTRNLLAAYSKEEENNAYQDFLKVPIGKIGREPLYFKMGLASTNYHAFVAGMTGMGKTNLLNTLIVNIAKNYTAKEVELYLMDYKPGGVEFAIFKNHPNCKKLFLSPRDTTPALNMLREFQEEMYERSKMMQGKNIYEYNSINTKNPLPWKILIIDEIQRMFGETYKDNDILNDILEDIVKTGRSFGLHLILTTQSLKQIKLRDNIMGQIGLKLSFGLSDTMEAMKIFNENKEATKKVVSLKPYHFVYADSQQTVTARADYTTKEEIEQTFNELRAQRAKNEVLTPELILPTTKNEKVIEEESSQKQSKTSLPKEKESFSYTEKYSVSEQEREALEKLRKMEAESE